LSEPKRVRQKVCVASVSERRYPVRKVIVDEWLTLDGVAQAPGKENESSTGGFRYGGWHIDYVDEAFQKRMLGNLDEAGGPCLAGNL